MLRAGPQILKFPQHQWTPSNFSRLHTPMLHVPYKKHFILIGNASLTWFINFYFIFLVGMFFSSFSYYWSKTDQTLFEGWRPKSKFLFSGNLHWELSVCADHDKILWRGIWNNLGWTYYWTKTLIIDTLPIKCSRMGTVDIMWLGNITSVHWKGVLFLK